MTVARHQEPETHRLAGGARARLLCSHIEDVHLTGYPRGAAAAGFGLEPEPTVELTQEFGFDGYRSPTDEIQSPCSHGELAQHFAILWRTTQFDIVPACSCNILVGCVWGALTAPAASAALAGLKEHLATSPSLGQRA
jgi:hypothetical protein